MTSYRHNIPNVSEDKKGIRHAEKRRTATCLFADRIAQISVEQYRRIIPESERPPQTCLATVVAHDTENDVLTVQGLGVGTKFLTESVLRDEAESSQYGRRVRDCHAEVLARRAFRRQLTLEILNDLKSPPPGSLKCYGILERSTTSSSYRLRSGVTLHFYTSSAPCGNATLKKFAKMTKEKFREELGPEEWPLEPHEPILGSSVQLGQFSLLIKKDSESFSTTDHDSHHVVPPSTRKAWPATLSDEWTPPGTTIVGMKDKGSIHTCSDKICRWNYLGLQGSLLASLLDRPVYPSSMTVGRKFTSCICRRAVCCRMEGGNTKKLRKTKQLDEKETDAMSPTYRLHHPAVMGTAVYMDESGVVETSSDVRGQDVRFHSSTSWCWWPFLEQEAYTGYVEQIDGSSGYVWKCTEDSDSTDETTTTSRVSTESLTKLFLDAHLLAQGMENHGTVTCECPFATLEKLRTLKRELSSFYETAKDDLLSKHPVFRQWRRRYLPPDDLNPATAAVGTT